MRHDLRQHAIEIGRSEGLRENVDAAQVGLQPHRAGVTRHEHEPARQIGLDRLGLAETVDPLSSPRVTSHRTRSTLSRSMSAMASLTHDASATV